MSRYIIEKEKLDENIEIIKAKAGGKVIGVVKGNGYGFGLKNMAAALVEHGIEMLAVTEIEDIAELKELNSDIDVLVMRSTCVEEEAEAIAKAGAIATIGSLSAAQVMSEASKKLGVETRCHLKIDTGMSRYGFTPAQIEEAVVCYSLDNLKFEGVYTHFANATISDELTEKHLEAFLGAVEKIKARVGDVGVLHAANSAAFLNLEKTHLDAVRIGSAFTGRVIARDKAGLNRLGCLEAEVIEVKTVPKGTPAGYNGEFRAKRETKIAIVPIGHYDGFGVGRENEAYTVRTILGTVKRFLKKQGLTMSINGKAYAVIGQVGLDHTALDVTGSEVKAGDIASADAQPLFVNPKIKRIIKK